MRSVVSLLLAGSIILGCSQESHNSRVQSLERNIVKENEEENRGDRPSSEAISSKDDIERVLNESGEYISHLMKNDMITQEHISKASHLHIYREFGGYSSFIRNGSKLLIYHDERDRKILVLELERGTIKSISTNDFSDEILAGRAYGGWVNLPKS